MGFIGDAVGGVLGMGGGYDDAAATYAKAEKEFRDLKTPDAEALLKRLKDVQYLGDLTPEQQRVFEQEASGMGSISEDPRLREAQMRALTQLQDIGSSGGMTAIDKARLSDIQRTGAAQERGSREAILQNMKERGMGGSGFEMAAQLANQQGSADRQSQAGLDVAAEAQDRALQAIQGAGQMGGQVRGQEFAMAAERAQAQDAINRFNAANRQGVEGANVGARNYAAERNLSTRQGLEAGNTGMRNDAMMNLTQAQFDNEMRRRQGITGQLGNQAQNQVAQGSARDKFMGGLIGSGAKAFGFGAPNFV